MARQHSGTAAEQQLAVLRQQFTKLESESANRYEAAQQNIKQNRQLWLTLKQQNKDLKQEVAKRGGTVSQDTGKSQVDRTIERLEKEVHELRRQYDKTMQEKKTVVSKLDNLQDSLRELTKPAPRASSARDSGGSSKEARDLRQLENRLDKALMKCNEAQSIRRTYEQVLDKMRGEAAGFDTHLRTLEEAVAGKTGEKETMQLALRDANAKKESAKQELAGVEARIEAERAQREATLGKHRIAVQTLGEANKALLARQFGPGAMLSTQQTGAGSAGGTAGQEQGMPDGLEVGTPEAAVRMLCEATSTATITAMLDRLLPQQRELNKLLAMKASAAKQMAEVGGEVAGARSALEDLYAGGRGTTQVALDAAQQQLQEARADADAAQEMHNKVLHVYANVRSGLEHLASMLAPLPLPPGQLPVPLSDDTLGDVVAQCQLRLTAALAFFQTIPKAAAMMEDILANSDYTFAPAPTPAKASGS